MSSGKIIAGLSIVSILIVLAISKLHESSRLYFEESVPAEFEITDTVFSLDETGCGLAIFRISDSTVSAIQSKNLAFFENAKEARVFHKYGYNHYSDWEETPVPKDWNSEGSWFYCGHHEMLGEIIGAGRTPGSFYSTSNNGEAKFIVVPALGVLVYSFFD